eukprot:CAMPEP_0115760826 /NCGR_PEP_ID=MMETSP0272-20121206/100196_1 /TAXON_ID=71861 /ORGANISM="Scrippsiella trochoidea, Strain CCMP3099" /LENGTH=536 /DNA_ID=CAMNT_0003206497 /DNA_START=1 /DNA_END=1607 /DNA_ORIENTATION=+
MMLSRRHGPVAWFAAITVAGGGASFAVAQGGVCDALDHDHVLLQAHRFRLAHASGKTLVPHLYTKRSLTAHQGRTVRSEFRVANATECATLCDGTDACRSFTYSDWEHACHLKDKEVSEDDSAQVPGNWHYSTYMRSGPHGSADDEETGKVSTDDEEEGEVSPSQEEGEASSDEEEQGEVSADDSKLEVSPDAVEGEASADDGEEGEVSADDEETGKVSTDDEEEGEVSPSQEEGEASSDEEEQGEVSADDSKLEVSPDAVEGEASADDGEEGEVSADDEETGKVSTDDEEEGEVSPSQEEGEASSDEEEQGEVSADDSKLEVSPDAVEGEASADDGEEGEVSADDEEEGRGSPNQEEGEVSSDEEEGKVSPEEWEHFQLVNQLRAQGFTCPGGMVFEPNPVAIKLDCRLWKAARLHSEDMAAQGYFNHMSKDGRSPWERAYEQGISAKAENIYAGGNSAEGPMSAWKGSDGHCKNMMAPDSKIFGGGVGGESYPYYWTQMFGWGRDDVDTTCYPSEAALVQLPQRRRAAPPAASA